MGMYIPRSFRIDGYEVLQIDESIERNFIHVHLRRKHDKPFRCRKCGTQLLSKKGEYELKAQDMPVRGMKLVFIFKRWKGHCPRCHRIRSEHCEFLSDHSPHFTQDYFWWLGRLCEIAPVSRAASLMQHDDSTLWRMDLKRMQLMLEDYQLPHIKRISADEVHARSKKQLKLGENRNDEFFTVITDLDSHKVIWVADSRRKEALDQFFFILGKEACEHIEVVAVDQHEDYAASVRDNCPKATLVWDRFHIMQNFQIALNEVRKELHERMDPKDPLFHLTRGKYKYLFLKNANKRTSIEQRHIDFVLKENEEFAKLDVIREAMIQFFESPSEIVALDIWLQIGRWVDQLGFEVLKNWYRNLEKGWDTLKNYFTYKVTTAVSEGINNVIKALKRKAFGYKNMAYFKLKIMQQCGFLNSKHLPDPYLLRRQKRIKSALAAL